MNPRLLLPALFCLSAACAQAQFGSFGDIPIELTASGETRFVNGVAIAENNVVIHYGSTSIYADYVQYNPQTRDVLAIGNIRLYQEGKLVTAERALYNMETKLLRTTDFRSSAYPFFTKGETFNSLPDGTGYETKNAIATTSDSSKPDYYVAAGNARIHPNEYITLQNVTLHIGSTPIFWFPYIYQSLKEEAGFSLTPGYSSDWGAYLLNRYGFPITDNLNGMFDLDLRSRRGVAVGFESKTKFGPGDKSWARFQSYYADDTNSSINNTANVISPVSSSRYRVSLQSRTYFTEDVYANVDINKLSDYRFLRDFYPSEYHLNPQPDNVVSLTKWNESYTVTGIFRRQLNDFFDTTERLPEIALDITRQPVLHSPVFYEGETSLGRLSRNFGSLGNTDALHPVATDALFHDYSATRFDTFHQFTLPKTFDGWLSVIPRAGFRATAYSAGAQSQLADLETSITGLDLNKNAQALIQTKDKSAVFRPVFNTGIESSFKLSREWEDIQSRAWGIDGLRHVFQPYTDLSLVYSGKNPDGILQFDRLTPSTELPPIGFPQFTTIDSISNWSIWRFGFRNNLQTRRDDGTTDLLEMDTFLNANLDAPSYPGIPREGAFSNLCNKLVVSPVPWVAFNMNTQVPLTSTGFTQINTGVHFLTSEDLSFTVGHTFLNDNPYFANANNVSVAAYYRINDNWGISVSDQYEIVTRTLQRQDYAIYRDLSSWVASLGFTIKENINSTTGQTVTDLGVVLTFTLKDLPNIRLPLSFHPSSGGL